LWSVADTSTMLLMVRFYALWRGEGLEPAQALRQAQRWLRDTTNRDKQAALPGEPALAGPAGSAKVRAFWADAAQHAHPVHWAAFTFTGVNGPPTVEGQG
jgi:CHAT domain-containing protein